MVDKILVKIGTEPIYGTRTVKKTVVITNYRYYIFSGLRIKQVSKSVYKASKKRFIIAEAEVVFPWPVGPAKSNNPEDLFNEQRCFTTGAENPNTSILIITHLFN